MSRSLAVPPVERLPERWEIPRSVTSRRPSRQRCTRGARGIRGTVTPSLNCSVLSHDSVLPSGGALAAGKVAASPAWLLFMKKPANSSGSSAEMRQILHKQRQEGRGKAADGPGKAAGQGKAGHGAVGGEGGAGLGRRLKTGDHDLAGTENGRPGRDDRAARSFVEWALRGSNPRPAD